MLEVRCPYCASAAFVKRGTRTNAYQTVQLYLCRGPACGRTFTGRDLKGTKFPLAVVADGLTFYNLGYTLEQACQFLKLKFGVRPSTDTLAAWYAAHAPLCRFERMRPYALKLFASKDMVEVVTLAHRQLYQFRYHRAKMQLMLEEFGNRRFGPLKEYLDNVSSETPHQYFQEGERISDIRSRFSTADMLVKQKQNYANRLATFVLAGVRNRSRRHDELQRFFLANDSVTVATEVPVYIRREDIEHLQNALHFDLVGEEGVRFRGGKRNEEKVGGKSPRLNGKAIAAAERGVPRLLTGHIDFVQVRNGSIHLLDYKPKAAKERPIEQLTWYALALSRLTGLRLFDFVCGWFDETDYFEFYPLHVVKKLKRPGKPVQFKTGVVAEVPRTDTLTVADMRRPSELGTREKAGKWRKSLCVPIGRQRRHRGGALAALK